MAMVNVLVSALLASVRWLRSSRICYVSLSVLVVSLSWGEMNDVM